MQASSRNYRIQDENIQPYGFSVHPSGNKTQNQGIAKNRIPLGERQESTTKTKRRVSVVSQNTRNQGSKPVNMETEDTEFNEPCFDIDGEENGESWEYRKNVFSYLRTIEGRHFPDPNYMFTSQTEINSRMRAILVDWLNEVAQEYSLKRETLHLTVNFLDRFLSRRPVSRDRLQLVGITCMLIASKYSEINPPSIEEFVYITDSAYSRLEVIAMESMILKKLKFELTAVTAIDFLPRYLQCASVDNHHTVINLAHYLCELCLLDYEMVGVPPSKVAACAVCLALHTVSLPAWNSAMQHYTGYDGPDLFPIIAQMLKGFVSANTEHTLAAAKEKYSHQLYYRVSLLRPPRDLPRLMPASYLIN
eukprot:gb/GECH01014181.1/.p1 GENE.gb/GECH01014181.1/~~gb/GECH01014181.1/.p1  ORF type:complete len:363 (+),score=56.19 gb/GECH01014181.1/:1-1089(+)